MNKTNGGKTRSDALVLFGATGDLAYKKIFPALYALSKREIFTMPVVGVASPKWSSDQLRQRAMESIRNSVKVVDQQVLDYLLSLLSYVSGDYNDRNTFTTIKKALGSARSVAHYLAIPPSLFKTVIQGLAAAGMTEQRRVIVESPSGAIWLLRAS